MRGGIVAVSVTALAFMLAGCGGSGVSQAEHDQLLAELALTQQDLAEVRRELAGAVESGGGESSRADALEAGIEEIIRNNNIVLGAQQDPLEELGRLVADFHEREAGLMAEMEALISEFETTEYQAQPEAPKLDVAPYVELLSSVVTWLAASELPTWQEVSVAQNALEQAGDPDLFAHWDTASGGYDDLEPATQRQWLADLAGLALMRIGAEGSS